MRTSLLDSRPPGLVVCPSRSSLKRLPAELTINGVTKTPDMRYAGRDATTAVWPAWGYGPQLTIAGAGAAVTPNAPTPLLDATDVGCQYNGTAKYHYDTGKTIDIADEDFVIECVFKTASAYETAVIWGKFINGTKYFELQSNAGGTHSVLMYGASGAATIGLGALATSTWYHVIIFGDKSGFGVAYINATAGSAANLSSVGSLTMDAGWCIGARLPGGAPSKATIAYLSLWLGAAWLDTHLQAAVALDRMERLTGIRASLDAGGLYRPTSW